MTSWRCPRCRSQRRASRSKSLRRTSRTGPHALHHPGCPLQSKFCRRIHDDSRRRGFVQRPLRLCLALDSFRICENLTRWNGCLSCFCRSTELGSSARRRVSIDLVVYLLDLLVSEQTNVNRATTLSTLETLRWQTSPPLLLFRPRLVLWRYTCRCRGSHFWKWRCERTTLGRRCLRPLHTSSFCLSLHPTSSLPKGIVDTRGSYWWCDLPKGTVGTRGVSH